MKKSLFLSSSLATCFSAVITITGTLIKDRDFGPGYTYAVISENITVTK